MNNQEYASLHSDLALNVDSDKFASFPETKLMYNKI